MERPDSCQYVEGLFQSLGNCEFKKFYLSFFQQAFTRKSNKLSRFKKFQENSRCCEHHGFSWNFLNLHGLLDFLVKACWQFLEIPSYIFLQEILDFLYVLYYGIQISFTSKE